MGQLQIIFFGTFSFPAGDAAGARILELAKGAVELGNRVTVISLFGEVKGWQQLYHKESQINYYTAGLPKSVGSDISERIKDRLHFYRSKAELVECLKDAIREVDNNVIYFYGRSYFYLNATLNLVSKMRNEIKVCLDIVEPPAYKQGIVYALKHPFSIDSRRSFSHNLLNRVDLAVFISHGLKDDYSKYVKKYVVIPSVVSDDFKDETVETIMRHKNSSGVLKLGYLGALLEKDDPARIFDLCANLKEQGVEFEFNILGRSKMFKEGRIWRAKLESSAFSEDIVYHDDIRTSEIQMILKSMDYNILLRAKDVLQLKTFPTRIIDLLRARRPLILNLFGDLNQYFTNELNCIDIECVSSWTVISEKLQDEELRNILAENAHGLLKESFNAQYHVAKLGAIFFNSNAGYNK